MNAPDKICAIEAEDGIKWFMGEAPSSWEAITYIRKDALLEWLKDGLAHLENGGLASEIGAMTLQEVIDKLNSM